MPWTMLLKLPEHIHPAQRILPMLAALLIAAATVELIRRRQLREEHAMLWIFASAVLVVFAIYPPLLWIISEALGLFYLTTVFLLGFSLLSLVLMHISVTVSRISDDKRRIAQRVALLERQIELLRDRCPAPDETADAPTDSGDAGTQGPGRAGRP
jgi:hypothetical protein